eukprot:gene8567-33999_t
MPRMQKSSARSSTATQALMTMRHRAALTQAPEATIMELSAPSFKPFLQTKDQEHLTVVYYLTQKCGPCKIAAPVLKRWAREFDEAYVSFAKVDCSACEENARLASDMDIKAFPTFHVYQGGSLVGVSVGAKMMKLKGFLEQQVQLRQSRANSLDVAPSQFPEYAP